MDKYAPTRKALREWRIANGRCRDCNADSLIEGKNICASCFDKRKLRVRYWQDGKRLNSQCRRCGENSVGKTLCVTCMNLQIEDARFRRKTNRQFVIAHFGGKCEECGENHQACLTLDHVDGDGSEDCKSSTSGKRISSPEWYARLYKMIKANIQLPKLKLLCFNCHAKKDLMPWWLKD